MYRGGGSGDRFNVSPNRSSDYRERPGTRAERRRFDELLDTGHRRGLNRDEFRELEDLRRRLGL